MPALSDQEIMSRAAQMRDAGGTPEQIRQYIDLAKAEQGASAPAKAPGGFDATNYDESGGYARPVNGKVSGGALAMPVRMAGNVLATEGGPTGAGINLTGELIAQALEGKFDHGRQLAAAGLGAVPFGSSLGPVQNVLRSAVAGAGTKLLGDSLNNTIANGGVPTPVTTEQLKDAGKEGALFGSGEAASPVVGQIFKDPSVRDEVVDSVRNQNIRKFIKEGGVVPPSIADPTHGNAVLDFIGNRANIAREAALANDETAVRLAKQTVGIPDAGGELTDEWLQRAKDRVASQYYQPIEQMGRRPAKALQDYKDAKSAYQDAVAAHQMNRLAETREAKRQAALDLANAEARLQQFVGNDGMNLVRQGDKEWAQIMDVENAANTKSGSLDPSKLRRVDDETGKLTGGLETIADFNGAVGPAISKEASKIQAPIISRLFAGMGGGIGYSHGGLTGMAIGATAPSVLEKIVREYQLSRYVQNRLAQPVINRGYQPMSGVAAAVARAAAMQGQDSNP